MGSRRGSMNNNSKNIRSPKGNGSKKNSSSPTASAASSPSRPNARAKSFSQYVPEVLKEFPEQPIPLISFSKDEDLLKVNEEAIDLLQKIQGNVAVIALAGLYRTGKSSMLNWLLGRQDGFRVGPTIERCTRGIWLWGQPQKYKTLNGEDVWVLMLDTEGLGGLEVSQQYDVRIFSLVTLLCSKLIYNSQGSVDEKAVNGLSFIANLTKHIRIHASGTGEISSGNENDAEQFHQFFPSFTWIVRDFTLELVDEDGDPMSSNEYLEKALAPQPGLTPAVMERNRVRHMMTSFFKERQCVTLVRPVHDENKLQQVDQLPIQKLRPEFQKQLKELKRNLFGPDNIKPKMLQNKPLNGSMFAGLLQAYVDAINHGGVPVITSAWEGVTSSECRKALSKAMVFFETQMEEQIESLVPLDEEELIQLIQQIEEKTMVKYHEFAIHMGHSFKQMEKELQKEISDKKKNIHEKNHIQSKEMCDRLLQVLYNEIIQPQLTVAMDSVEEEKQTIGGETETLMQIFLKEWTRFRETYLLKARGNAKLQSLVTFSEMKYGEAMRIILSKQEEMYEKQMRLLQNDVAKVKEELGSVGGREQVYKKQIQQIQQDQNHILSEKVRLEAETQAQELLIQNLKEQLQKENDTKHSVELERETIDLKFNTEMKKKEIISDELLKIKQEYERLIKEKEKQETELGLLTEECEQLRMSKGQGQTCGCTIS